MGIQESGHIKRTIIISSTRRAPQIHSNDNDLSVTHDEALDNEDDGEIPALIEGTTATSTTHPSSPATSLAPPLLSMLSIRSPAKSRTAKMDEIRAKAIFNPIDAARLEAMKRGQNVYIAGEGGDEDEDDDAKVMDIYEGGAVVEDEEGDEDWQSENEGWKRTSVDDEEVW